MILRPDLIGFKLRIKSQFKVIIRNLFCCSILFLTACGQDKVAYYKSHPQEMFAAAMACTKLKNSEVLNDKNCLAIAQIEKAPCEQELQIKGTIMLPNGLHADCDNPYYLISRPITEAQMRAVLEGQPDPVSEYIQSHKTGE